VRYPSRSRSGPGIAAIKDDIGAGIRRRQRDHPAETPASAGNEEAFSIQTETIKHIHRFLPREASWHDAFI